MANRGYATGEILICNFSVSEDYLVGKEYKVAALDKDGWPRMRSEDGYLPRYGIDPKSCRVYRFDKKRG